MSVSSARAGAYTKVDIETASQGKLIVMLFNGAIKRSEEAKRQMEKGSIDGVHKNLIRAQEIIGELRGALNMNAGDISANLDRIYEYFQHLLITANMKKNPNPIDECVGLMTEVRNMWQDVFDMVAKEGGSTSAPQYDPHGAAVLNMVG